MATGNDDRTSDGGDDSLRRCIVTGERLSPEAMIRFVVGPGDSIVPDILGKLPGRGLWVRADRDSLAEAATRGRFAHAARRSVQTGSDLPERVEALLTKRSIDLIALARRAGETVAGFEKVRGWLASGRAAVLIEASDGSDGGRSKIMGLAGELPVVDVLRASELGMAFGRDRAVHVALARGGLADKVRAEAARLRGFRTVGGEWGKE